MRASVVRGLESTRRGSEESGTITPSGLRSLGQAHQQLVVSSHILNRKGVLERFLREIRSAAQLPHPNIVTASSATRVGESIVFSMQFVDGYDLSKLVEKSGPLSVAHACNFVYQAALGLQHAHKHGMVHRDIVPAELAAVVAKMLAKEPERRFQTPAAVAEALKPFFKPGANPGSRPSPEISRVGPAASSPQPVGGGSAPAQPATLGTAPAPAPRGPSKPNPDRVAWESLIEFKQTETVKEPAPAVEAPGRQKPPWMWPAIAAAFSLALIALGVIIYVTTDYGRIKIIVDGPKADVQVDGEQILIKTPRESIALRAGTHELAVKWGDGEFKTRDFVVHRGNDEELRVEYEPKYSPDKPPASPAEAISRTLTDGMLIFNTCNIFIIYNAKVNFPIQVDPNIRATSSQPAKPCSLAGRMSRLATRTNARSANRTPLALPSAASRMVHSPSWSKGSGRRGPAPRWRRRGCRALRPRRCPLGPRRGTAGAWVGSRPRGPCGRGRRGCVA